mmetsp:Transcript_25799/g.64579  ORF Transcript_25799/g.64579 Transcript_25799/m.64579 type:complete len:212 (-) Transcript_25799:423-1058(-)
MLNTSPIHINHVTWYQSIPQSSSISSSSSRTETAMAVAAVGGGLSTGGLGDTGGFLLSTGDGSFPPLFGDFASSFATALACAAAALSPLTPSPAVDLTAVHSLPMLSSEVHSMASSSVVTCVTRRWVFGESEPAESADMTDKPDFDISSGVSSTPVSSRFSCSQVPSNDRVFSSWTQATVGSLLTADADCSGSEWSICLPTPALPLPPALL